MDPGRPRANLDGVSDAKCVGERDELQRCKKPAGKHHDVGSSVLHFGWKFFWSGEESTRGIS